MTTESKQSAPRGVSPLLGAAAASALLVVILVPVGALVSGPPGALGALVGGGLGVAVFAFGTGVVHVVSDLLPSASLLLALLTYLLQLLVVAAVATGLETSGVAGESLSRGWFGAGIIAVALWWLAVQVWLFTRLRIPAYDLAPNGRPGGEG